MDVATTGRADESSRRSDSVRNPPALETELAGLLSQVPTGRVTTFLALAEALGSRMAAPWIGHYVLHHRHRRGCTCHRVVRSTGEVGRYTAGVPASKVRRLRGEGVAVRGGRVDLVRFGFQGFHGQSPLARLRKTQESLLGRLSLTPPRTSPTLVAGVDVSYAGEDMGIAAYALVRLPAAELISSVTVRRRVTFPYISTFLAFRELPILLQLLDTVRRQGRVADVLLVDGGGILHHRHAGIATHLGIVAGIPTVGITKTLLCGHVPNGESAEDSRPVVHEGRVIGAALRPTSKSRKPIYVSPGHRTDVPFARGLVRRLLLGHRLPEPVYWADRLSHIEARRGPTQSG